MIFRTGFASLALTLIFSGSVLSQYYLGSYNCAFSCHNDLYNNWQASGHGNALFQIFSAPPQYPFQFNPGSSNVPSPPVAFGSQLGWDDVSFVIGGYRWKANFLDLNGYLLTGSVSDQTQWKIESEQWAPYHPGEQQTFDCASCHSTGYDEDGHQGGMTGIQGTWVEDGVGCESCHGPNT